MRSDIFLFCIIWWLVFVPSQSTGSSANQSPRSSHAECTCKILIHIKIVPCFRSQKCGVCFKPDTNHQSELVKRNVFLPLRRILARVSVRRGSRRTYLSTFLLSRAFSLSTFSDFQWPPSSAWGRWGGCRQWRCEGLWRVGQKWFRRQRRDPSSLIWSVQSPPCGEKF